DRGHHTHPDPEQVLGYLNDDAVGQAEGDPLVDRPGLKGVSEGVRMWPAKRDRAVMLPALRAAALGRDVFPDRLPAPAPGEDKVDGCPLDRSLRIRHEIDIVLRTSLPGFHQDRTAGLRGDTVEVLMTLPPFRSLRDVLRTRLTD